MKVLKNFNNISEKLIEECIPKLEGVASFHMLTGTTILHVNEDGGETKEFVYPKVQIPTRDRIKDPFTGKYVDIGVVKDFDGDNVKSTVFFMPGMGTDRFAGRFSLHEGNVDEEEMYEYLCICNYNAKNPHRDKRVEPLFEIVDTVAESKQTRKKTSKLRDALITATDMGLNDARDFAASMNWNYDVPEDVLRGQIESYAQSNPDEFLKRNFDPNVKVKSDIKRAVDSGIVNYDPSTNKILWAKGNVTIATLERQEGVSWLDAFADFVLTSANGNNVIQGIRKRLKASLKEELVNE